MVGQSVAYPLDVVRRRMQTDGMRQPRTNLCMTDVAKVILQAEGVRGMFKGLTLNWIKVRPVADTTTGKPYRRWDRRGRGGGMYKEVGYGALLNTCLPVEKGG